MFKQFHSWFDVKNFLRVNAFMIIFALIPLAVAIFRTVKFTSPIWMRFISIIIEIIAVIIFVMLNQKRQVKYEPSEHPILDDVIMCVTYVIGVGILFVIS